MWRKVEPMRIISLFTLVLVAVIPISTAGAQSIDEARAMADQATTKARAGQTNEALQLYARALVIAPENMEILRDYAVVLGWAGQYSTAIPVIRKVRALESDQPDWARREFAATYLFGDLPAEALKAYDDLIARGDGSEQTLNRRALALRWLGKTDLARTAYRGLVEHYPKSVDGTVGLAYTMSDEGELSEALSYLESNTQVSPQDPEILKARIRILNWMGRHYEAQRLLATLPPTLRDDREVLEDRIAASRWGGNPNGAMQDLNRLTQLFPGAASRQISRELRTEYGQSASPFFRFAKDNDGLMDRSAGGDVTVHLNPAYAVHVGYQYRWLEQQQEIRALLHYDLGFSGVVNRRISFYTTVGTVDYRTNGLRRKTTGDASVTVALNDRLRITGGAGSIAMDAYQSIPRQVTAPFVFGDVSFNFDSNTRFQTRVSRYSFSDGVIRRRADFQIMRSVFREPRFKLNAGWRSSFMGHDNETPDFWSPSRFQSHFAVAQGEGRLTSWLDYSAEIAGGWQSEPGIAIQHPFQTVGRVVVHPNRYFRVVLETGRSTSSMDRALPGQRNYSRWVNGATLELRFP